MPEKQTVFIVDDDQGIREGLSLLMASVAQPCETFCCGTEFLDAYEPGRSGCLVLDIRMPRMSGLEVQARLNELGSALPVIFITGHGDIPMAVEAMRRGALDFIRKPFREQDLLDRINEALTIDKTNHRQAQDDKHLEDKLESLTEREQEIFHLVANGKMNKQIAFDLGISERTVEVHRAQVMKKLGIRTLAELVRIKLESELLHASE